MVSSDDLINKLFEEFLSLKEKFDISQQLIKSRDIKVIANSIVGKSEGSGYLFVIYILSKLNDQEYLKILNNKAKSSNEKIAILAKCLLYDSGKYNLITLKNEHENTNYKDYLKEALSMVIKLNKEDIEKKINQKEEQIQYVIKDKISNLADTITLTYVNEIKSSLDKIITTANVIIHLRKWIISLGRINFLAGELEKDLGNVSKKIEPELNERKGKIESFIQAEWGKFLEENSLDEIIKINLQKKHGKQYFEDYKANVDIPKPSGLKYGTAGAIALITNIAATSLIGLGKNQLLVIIVNLCRSIIIPILQAIGINVTIALLGRIVGFINPILMIATVAWLLKDIVTFNAKIEKERTKAKGEVDKKKYEIHKSIQDSIEKELNLYNFEIGKGILINLFE